MQKFMESCFLVFRDGFTKIESNVEDFNGNDYITEKYACFMLNPNRFLK